MDDIFIISDSPTFLLEKVARKKNINIKSILGFNNFSESEIPYNCTDCIVLISESFYKYLENYKSIKFDFDQNNFIEFQILNKIIIKLHERGIQIFIPFLPKHFLYFDMYGSVFYKDDSIDLFIQKINNKLFDTFKHYDNVFFLKGIKKLSNKISKTYFRFGSIYDAINSNEIIYQFIYTKNILLKTKKKLIILDLDNTLWKGILDEDSLDGISADKSDPIGAIYNAAQKIFLKLKNKGFLLAICSKNDEKQALNALFNSNLSLFKKDDIVTYRINWKSKSQNIIDICKEINISLEDTIFIDDSEYECDEVKKNCKGISIVNVPNDIYQYPNLLAKNELLYHNYSIEEDYLRTEMYKKNIVRLGIKDRFKDKEYSKEEWIKSLNLKIDINKINAQSQKISRIIQLFNRTNQFNLSGSKYNISSFNLMLENNIYYSGSASDRIGSEGLISVIGFSYKKNLISVHDFILSCRVFGRFIEETMLLPLLDFAILKNCDVVFNLKKNSRNLVVNKFINKIAPQNNYLKIEQIYYLKNKYSNLPVDIFIKKAL